MGARNYDDGVAQPFFEQPILNSPYEYPARHWELDENRQPTNHIVDRRRTVSFITPIPAPASNARLSASWVWMMPAARRTRTVSNTS